MMPDLLVGVDLGSTAFKVVACDVSGREVATASTATPWSHDDKSVVLNEATALRAIDDLIARCLDRAGAGRVVAVGITGMAESGFLVAADGRAQNDAYAWNDPQGQHLLEDIDGADAFSARTGLPVSARCSAVKSRWMTTTAVHEPQLRWENLPEWFARVLTGNAVAELSLAARSGFLDIHRKAWIPEILTWSGIDPAAMPEPQPAGTVVGVVRNGPGRLLSASVTVAGHDHVCAAVGAGATAPGDAFDSLGTGEAVLRTIADPLGEAETLDAVRSGLTVGVHVLPNATVIMAGLGMGWRLKAVLDALGVGKAERASFDDAALAASYGTPAEWVDNLLLDGRRPPFSAGAGLTRDAAVVLWRYALIRAAEICRDALARLSVFAGDHDRVVAAGGWFRSEPVTALRRHVLGEIVRPDLVEATGRGAALFAGQSVGAVMISPVAIQH